MVQKSQGQPPGMVLVYLVYLVNNGIKLPYQLVIAGFLVAINSITLHLKVLKSFTFWAGGLAGVVSAAATHQLDVAKTSLDSGWRDLEVGRWKGDDILGCSPSQ